MTSAGRARFVWANTLRGLAALTVVIFHFCVVFWNRQDVAAGLARRPALYAGDEGAPGFARVVGAIPLDLGGLGVATFFLLSGFVIAISLDRYSRRGFLVGRLTRVLPTYAAGFLVTCATVWALGDPAHELGVGRVAAGSIPGLALVLGVVAPGDGIVWTLIIELIFYGVCLVTYRRLTSRWEAIAAAAVACIVVQLAVGPPAKILGSALGGVVYVVLLACPFVPVMLIGVLLSARSRGQVSRRVAGIGVPVLAGVHLALLSSTKVMAMSWEYRMTFLVAIVLFVVVWRWAGGWSANPVSEGLASLSYPLYVVHPVLGYGLLSVLSSRGVSAAVSVVIATSAVFAAAAVLHHVVEVPTHLWGQRRARRLSGPAPDPTSAQHGAVGGVAS